jgi:hypothetical protein
MVRRCKWLMMKQRIGFPMLLLVAVVFLAQCSTFQGKPSTEPEPIRTGGTPVIELPETSHDMGQVAAGGEYSHEFVVRNKGTGFCRSRRCSPGAARPHSGTRPSPREKKAGSKSR